jgi:predicted nicotinamide N-methyase
VTAVDWAEDAVRLLERNAARNRLALRAVHADWRTLEGAYDLALAADVLYEERYVEPLLEVLPRLAPEALLAEPGRPHAAAFLERAGELWELEAAGDRVHRLARRGPAAPGR